MKKYIFLAAILCFVCMMSCQKASSDTEEIKPSVSVPSDSVFRFGDVRLFYCVDCNRKEIDLRATFFTAKSLAEDQDMVAVYFCGKRVLRRNINDDIVLSLKRGYKIILKEKTFTVKKGDEVLLVRYPDKTYETHESSGVRCFGFQLPE